MTTTAPTLRTFVREPFDLALGQPHQMLISSASVAIVAVEAAALVPWPANIALAVGAEWAYLRGLISGAGVKTPWAARLNWSAVLLVVLYGSLASLRGFGQIPAQPDLWLAALLTIIHIGSISAVTLCSAMLHRAGAEAAAAARAAAERAEEDRQARLQAERDAMAIEMERKQQELAIWQQAEQARLARELERERTRAELRATVRAQRANSASGTAANSGANTSREQLRAQIARTLTEQPGANRSQLARALGIGRTTLYELIREAQQAGELPAE